MLGVHLFSLMIERINQPLYFKFGNNLVQLIVYIRISRIETNFNLNAKNYYYSIIHLSGYVRF